LTKPEPSSTSRNSETHDPDGHAGKLRVTVPRDQTGSGPHPMSRRVVVVAVAAVPLRWLRRSVSTTTVVPRGTAAEGEVAVVLALGREEEDGDDGGAKPCATSTTPPREAIVAHRTAAAEAAVRREEGIRMVLCRNGESASFSGRPTGDPDPRGAYYVLCCCCMLLCSVGNMIFLELLTDTAVVPVIFTVSVFCGIR